MNLQQLRTYIDRLSDSQQVLKSRLRGLISVDPFTEAESVADTILSKRQL